MKNIIRTFSSATILGILLVASPAVVQAQISEQTTTVRTTSSAGIVSEFGPRTLVIRSETSPEPIHYTYTKTTSYVDETGAPVSMELVKSGLPVTVYYERNGDEMVASKVIVRKAVRVSPPLEEVIPAAPPVVEEKKTTTTTIEK